MMQSATPRSGSASTTPSTAAVPLLTGGADTAESTVAVAQASVVVQASVVAQASVVVQAPVVAGAEALPAGASLGAARGLAGAEVVVTSSCNTRRGSDWMEGMGAAADEAMR